MSRHDIDELTMSISHMLRAAMEVAPTKKLMTCLKNADRTPLGLADGLRELEECIHDSHLEVFDEDITIIRDIVRLRSSIASLYDQEAEDLTNHGWARLLGMIRDTTIRAKALKISTEAHTARQ